MTASFSSIGLIETWDVLKSTACDLELDGYKGLIETWDVLKYTEHYAIMGQSWFNRNMGCIEIFQRVFNCGNKVSLIETWDVLKYVYLLQK